MPSHRGLSSLISRCSTIPRTTALCSGAHTECVLSHLRTAGISMCTISETSKPYFREALRGKSVTPLGHDSGASTGRWFTTGRRWFNGAHTERLAYGPGPLGRIQATTFDQSTRNRKSVSIWEPPAARVVGGLTPWGRSILSSQPGFIFGDGGVNFNGPSNMLRIGPSVTFHLRRTLSLILDDDFFWRKSLEDGVSGLGVNLLWSGLDNRNRYLGTQPSAGMYWQANRHIGLAGAYTHFSVGPFLTQRASPERKAEEEMRIWGRRQAKPRGRRSRLTASPRMGNTDQRSRFTKESLTAAARSGHWSTAPKRRPAGAGKQKTWEERT